MLFRWRNPERPLSLALQGGGAHGAFTWGVLDALLEDGRLSFDGISGTSAGAMNAVALAQGLMVGGREGARAALQAFWEAVARSTPFNLSLGSDAENGHLAPGIKMLLYWARQFSPYQLNPFDINPLRDIVQAQFDFERLRHGSAPRLFIAATHANSGRLRLFTSSEISAQALLASACLPSLHHAIEIEGEPYWDGAYSANPAIYPLIYNCSAADILLVLLSPLVHGETPHTVEEIRNRALDLAFNSTFLREMRSFAHARAYAAGARWLPGRLDRRLHDARFHLIEAEALLSQLAAETRLATGLPFLLRLRDQGRARAQQWLASHYRALGRFSSTDIGDVF